MIPEKITKLREALKNLRLVSEQSIQAHEAITILDELLAENKRWHEEYLNASQDAMNFASKLNNLESK